MKTFWIKKGLIIWLMAIAATLLFGAVVMGLWNAILPAVPGVKNHHIYAGTGHIIAE